MRRRFFVAQIMTWLVLGVALCPLGLASEVANPVFGYTHLLPSPFTMPAGRLAIGTDVALGLTDFLQVGTGLIQDIYKVFNANAKVSLVDIPDFAFAVTLGYETYNYQDIDPANPDLRVNSWLPGGVAAFAVLPRVALFVGGNLNLSSTKLITNGIATSGFVTGGRVESDMTWAYNSPKKKSRSVGNAISGGVSYDTDYKLFGFGISHHWPGFHLGFHYYPNATNYKLQPILAGGVAMDF